MAPAPRCAREHSDAPAEHTERGRLTADVRRRGAVLDGCGLAMVRSEHAHASAPGFCFIGCINTVSGTFREIGINIRRIARR
ncbi:hypothetical protein [Actinacidiphila oryziradicis]|uniref:Uncharacterized protein n=1 Tax=Actinacidiphila oryziradicis TaxID=2571141 RepID=A0A4U0RWQ2_9ACTN|nr:hypothetical protein [Actinacidiphila oryziradicis]TKA00043.1 hypothetical protein FCI23_43640 [Actinacidiphila oryziradicis]